jgi:membrane protease subunit (stomatin/prohibitin family)
MFNLGMEVIEFFDPSGEVMVKRLPEPVRDSKTGKIIRNEAEIKLGAQLTVRESQVAVFFKDGKAYEVFKPGRYILKTKNIPLLIKVARLGYGENSPFRAEVYFCNMKTFRSIEWGTQEQIPFRDSELQIIRLGARGVFSMKISDPKLFITKSTGIIEIFEFASIKSYFSEVITHRFENVLAETISTVYDLPKIYDTLSNAVKDKLKDDFNNSGLELVDFYVVSVFLPRDVEKRMDERTGMNVIKNMNEYFQYNASQALKESAQSGGEASSGIGLGAGMSMGMKMIEQMDSNKGEKDNPFLKIEKLKELLDKGAITKEEFETKKKDLLDKI